MTEDEIINQLLNKIKLLAKKTNLEKYSVVPNLSFQFIGSEASQYRKFQFDIVLHKGGRLYAIFEIKDSNYIKKVDPLNLLKLSVPYMNTTGAEVFIVTDGDTFKAVYKNNQFEIFDIESLGEILFQLPSIQKIKEVKKDLINQIGVLVKKHALTNNEELSELLSPNSLFDIIEYDEAGYFKFKGDPNNLSSFENKMFLSLLPKFEDKVVYRYTTLSSLESMIRYNTFRMNGIAGMNDMTEVDYVDVYLNGGRVSYDNFSDIRVKEINRKYISSCSFKEKKDELTMWRLYGDESKGVCLKLGFHKERQNSNILLKPVSYGQNRTQHNELDFIGSINNIVATQINSSFVLLTFDTWKHFFKPHDYAVEKEVRLLYIENGEKPNIVKKDWIVTHSDRIFNPCVDFVLNSDDFPLFLEEVILGPNSPNKEVNFRQIKEWIIQKDTVPNYNISKVKIKISEIDNYRQA